MDYKTGSSTLKIIIKKLLERASKLISMVYPDLAIAIKSAKIAHTVCEHMSTMNHVPVDGKIDYDDLLIVNKVVEDISVSRSLRLFSVENYKSDLDVILVTPEYASVAKHYRAVGLKKKEILMNEISARIFIEKTGNPDFQHAINITAKILNKLFN